jgi:hypothetical protein
MEGVNESCAANQVKVWGHEARIVIYYRSRCNHNLTSCACTSLHDDQLLLHFKLTADRFPDPVDDGPKITRRQMMEPPWPAPVAAVERRFQRPIVLHRPEFHARSNPRPTKLRIHHVRRTDR